MPKKDSWSVKDFCNDPLDLLEFHPANALALQRAHHRSRQPAVGQLLQWQTRQFHEKKSAIRDEGRCPAGDISAGISIRSRRRRTALHLPGPG